MFWSDPDQVFSIWSDPDQVFSIWSDPDLNSFKSLNLIFSFLAVFIDKRDNTLLKYELYWHLCRKISKMSTLLCKKRKVPDPVFYRSLFPRFSLDMVGSGFGFVLKLILI